MRFRDSLALSTRVFKNRPLRTFLTILGVSVGIGTVLFLVSLGYGLQLTILNKITSADSLLSLDVGPGVSNLVELSTANIEEIRKIDGVSELSRMASLSSQISLKESTADSMIYAVDASFFRLNGVIIDAGGGFSGDLVYEAVISSAVAKLFNLDPNAAIGQEIEATLYVTKIDGDGLEEIETVKENGKYKIVGVVDDENTPFVYLPLESLNGVSLAKYDQLKAKVADSDLMGSVSQKIIEKGFLVSSLSDTIDQANKIFSIIQIILFSFGFVALLVSAIGMFNTMTIALLEKTNEIGIMRSLGMSSKDIRMIFLMESSIMGFLGGVGGVFVGWLAGFVINLAFNILASNLGGKPMNLFYTPWQFILMVIVFSGFVGFLTGLYPSRRASKLNPLDALRYK